MNNLSGFDSNILSFQSKSLIKINILMRLMKKKIINAQFIYALLLFYMYVYLQIRYCYD